jgi:hypothetical protein
MPATVVCHLANTDATLRPRHRIVQGMVWSGKIVVTIQTDKTLKNNSNLETCAIESREPHFANRVLSSIYADVARLRKASAL